MDENNNKFRINIPKSIFLTLCLIGLFNVLPKLIARHDDTSNLSGHAVSDTILYDDISSQSRTYNYDIHDILSFGRDNTQFVEIVNSEAELLSLSYRYSHLSDKEKALYAELQGAIRLHADRYDMKGVYTCQEVAHMLSQLQYIDEYVSVVGLPEVTSWSQDNIVKYIVMEYIRTKEDQDRRYKSAMNEVSLILSDAYGMSQYDAEKYFHDVIVTMADYDKTVDSHDASGIFLNNIAVCDGYSKAFKILCNRAGIACDIVVGNGLEYSNGKLVSSGPHAWNIVFLDHEVYYVDVTFDDGQTNDDVDYAYFNITQRDLLKSHEIVDGMFDFSIDEYTNYNYYNMMGYIAESESDFMSVFSSQVDDYINGYIPCVRVKVNNDALFNSFVATLGEGNMLISDMQQILRSKGFIYDNMVTYYSSNNTLSMYFR